MHYLPGNRGRHQDRSAPLTGRKDAATLEECMGGPQGLYPHGARVPNRAPQPRMQGGEARAIVTKEDD